MKHDYEKQFKDMKDALDRTQLAIEGLSMNSDANYIADVRNTAKEFIHKSTRLYADIINYTNVVSNSNRSLDTEHDKDIG